jgi:cell division protein FtsX
MGKHIRTADEAKQKRRDRRTIIAAAVAAVAVVWVVVGVNNSNQAADRYNDQMRIVQVEP